MAKDFDSILSLNQRKGKPEDILEEMELHG